MKLSFVIKKCEQMLKKIGSKTEIAQMSPSEIWSIENTLAAIAIFKEENETNEEEIKKLNEYLGGIKICQKRSE